MTHYSPQQTGEILRYLRQSAGLTQAELAERMGYASSSTISQFESGARKIPIDVLERSARVLGYAMEITFEERDLLILEKLL
jgi:transcriptional regulator with XRE-family HTH domain